MEVTTTIKTLDDTIKINAQLLALRPELDKGKVFDCVIKEHKEKRSTDANAYFHKLCNEIAEKLKTTMDEVKVRLNLEYGTMAAADGEPIIIALPAKVNPDLYYKYCKKISDFTSPKGEEMTQYFLYKETHTLDTHEMSRLIDGVITEAKELDIETKTPDKIAQMKSLWGAE